jgi:Protein phosphatase 2C
MGTSLMSNWKVAAASVRGRGHVKRDLPCQDAHHWVILPGEILVGAVADGAGSVSRSDVGSGLAVKTAVEAISERADQLTTLKYEREWLGFFQDICHLTLNVIEAEAEFLKVDRRELSTTLLLVVATPDFVVTAQVGDGAVVIGDDRAEVTGLTNPNVEEYLDFTTFITSPKAIDAIQIGLWLGNVAQVAMFSDGIQLLALKMPEGIPHIPFFLPLFQAIAQEPDVNEMNRSLLEFLSSDRVIDRTDDDITLLLAHLSRA